MLLLHDLHREQFTRTELARDEDDLAELALADDTMHLKVGERRHAWWRLRHVRRGLCASHSVVISVSVRLSQLVGSGLPEIGRAPAVAEHGGISAKDGG